jgi:hypothetical protein
VATNITIIIGRIIIPIPIERTSISAIISITAKMGDKAEPTLPIKKLP